MYIQIILYWYIPCPFSVSWLSIICIRFFSSSLLKLLSLVSIYFCGRLIILQILNAVDNIKYVVEKEKNTAPGPSGPIKAALSRLLSQVDLHSPITDPQI